MKEEYWVFGGALLFYFGRLLYQYYQKKRYEKVGDEIADFRYERYLELRDETFALKPEDLGIVLSNDNETAFALILEMHAAEALQAIVAFSDGKVWAFNTYNARKNIVDSDTEDLRSAAIEAVAASQYHFARMRRIDVEPLLPGHIKIHILTNQDTYSAGDTITAMRHESSEWAELVAKVFTVVRELDDAFKNTSKKHVYTPIAVKRSKPANF